MVRYGRPLVHSITIKTIARKTIFASLISATMAAALVGAGTSSASAIDPVSCDSKDYLQVQYHDFLGNRTACFANGGAYIFDAEGWATKIYTGNNNVQWFGDGRWQPDTPIGKWTTITWPNNPGGVRIDGVRIV